MIINGKKAPTTFGSKGWIYTIRKNEIGWWSIVVNHEGIQEEIPIAFCPYCGRYLK
jgi:hypothetical protein